MKVHLRWLPPQPLSTDSQINSQYFNLNKENYDFDGPEIEKFLEEEKKEEEKKSTTMNFKQKEKSKGAPKKEKRIKSSVENVGRSAKKNKSNFYLYY